jgi:hypothetical protein
MLEHNIENPLSENRITYRNSLKGTWVQSNLLAKNTDDTLWHQIKFANHFLEFKFNEDGSYSESKIYKELEPSIIYGEFFLDNFTDSTVLMKAPFPKGQQKFEIGDTMQGIGYLLTWKNDSTILMRDLKPFHNSYYLLELSKMK